MPVQKSLRHPLRAGVGRVDITPSLGCSMLGYPDPLRKAESIRDRLQATALAIESDGLQTVLISMDVIVVDEETVALIRKGIEKRTRIKGLHVTIHPIQTHSGPCTQSVWGWGERDEDYVFGTLVPAAVKATVMALKNLVPVRVGFGCVRSDVGVNRRKTAADGSLVMAQYRIGLHDPYMTVVRFESASGPLANLVHYGAHPTVFGSWNRAISRDWPGIMIDRMEHLTGATTLFIGGATGDVAPRTNNLGPIGDQTPDALWEAGACAAMDAMDTWRQIKDFRDTSMSLHVETIEMPYSPLPSIEEAKRKLKEAEPKKASFGVGMCEYKHWAAVLEAHRHPIKKAHCFPMTITAIGPLAIIPVPGEIFAETALRLREESPFQYTLISSLSGGCMGYFPTRESYARGGYEPWVAKAFGAYLLAEGIDDVLVKESLRLLKTLYSGMVPALPKK